MSDWREGFKHALIWEVVKQGAPVSETPSYYGWIHHDWQVIKSRALNGDVDYEATTIEESSWQEFQGTFYEGDEREYGVDVHLVMKSGESYHFRYIGSIGGLIMALATGAKEE